MMGLYAVLWGKNEEKRVAKKEIEELRKNLLDHGERKHEECAVIVSEFLLFVLVLTPLACVYMAYPSLIRR